MASGAKAHSPCARASSSGESKYEGDGGSIGASPDRQAVETRPVSIPTAPFARQLQDMNDPAVSEWLRQHWGAVHTSSAEKQKEMARLKAILTPELIGKADKNHGRALFAQPVGLAQGRVLWQRLG